MNSFARFQAEHHPSNAAKGIQDAAQLALFLSHEFDYQLAADELRGLRVLDLGCNTGFGTSILAETCEVVGVDVSEKSLAVAKISYPRIDFRHSEGSTFDFPDSSFDAVVVHQVIEHLTEPQLLIDELKRLLIGGGRAIITTPNGPARLQGAPPWNPFHALEYSADALSTLLSAGFRRVEVSGLRAHPLVDSLERERFARRRDEAVLVRRLESTLGELVKDRRFAGYEHSARIWVHLRSKAAEIDRMGELHTLRLEGPLFRYSDTEVDDSLSLRAVCWT